MRSQRGPEKVLIEYQKKTASLCEIPRHERHFCHFALEQLNIRNVIPLPNYGKRKALLGLCQQ